MLEQDLRAVMPDSSLSKRRGPSDEQRSGWALAERAESRRRMARELRKLGFDDMPPRKAGRAVSRMKGPARGSEPE